MSKILFIVGTAGLVACLYWWATFYNAFLDASGMMKTSQDWMDGYQLYGQCLFWDAAHCLSAKQHPKLTDYIPYRPHFAWISLGVLAAGALVRIRERWNQSGPGPNAPR